MFFAFCSVPPVLLRFWNRRYHFLTLFPLATVLVLSACGGGKGIASRNTSSAPTSTISSPVSTSGQFGQTEKIGAMRITIYSLERVEPGSLTQPAPGNEFIAFDIEACSDTDKGNINPFDFEVEMPDHTTRLQETYGVREPSMNSADLATGDCLRGWVSFETPAGVRPSFIIYSGEYGTTPFKWSVP